MSGGAGLWRGDGRGEAVGGARGVRGGGAVGGLRRALLVLEKGDCRLRGREVVDEADAVRCVVCLRAPR